MSAELTLRPYRSGDEAAILRAHARAFDAKEPLSESRTLEHWRWQFEECPAGAHLLLALDAEGVVHGQYAALRQRVRTSAGLLHFAQSVDSFHVRREGAGLARSSAFVRAGEAYRVAFCGTRAEQDQLVWGLANPAAWRSGSKRLAYQHVRTQMLLVAELADLPAHTQGGWQVDLEACAPHGVEALFESTSASRGAMAVRDKAWLDWRFKPQPGRRYEFGVVREQGLLRGLGVFRRGRFAGREGGLVCDWLVPARDETARRVLLSWFAERSRAAGERELLALLPDSAPEWLEFQRLGFFVAPTEYILAASPFHPALDREFLFRQWFYTLADTDLV